ncbi:hypoxanthine phosphoribosyltransferase [Microbacteriaceae bacterium SG_E_30_P1]|uniref:Hypoxanthine phosphoribosyltransferase n=1 Tax=Antiquaquibacter oligotrophicus TaxID=2880260 RepID=A0ABT6KKI0_9MICO|nr:phosphoribosyltransferase [Antiquaquibacter oligotrophicus]MDH6180517.1 hypoxanthine phosphoribosyltransferase [Antiquaquibacter oligotrophicus]UDF13749.1 phosphoribosyltransferase [Antiquaquibacter oligotrophicus]
MTAEAREILTWNDFGSASRELAADVIRSDYRPELVVAVARGGLLLAGGIAYALGIKSCGAVNAEFYTGVGTRLPEPIMLPPLLDEASIVGKRVLLVDDVSDSGRTLAMVVGLLETAGAEVRTVCLYSKPGTVHEPDYTWRRTDRWIVFPWSALPPVTADEAASGIVLDA